MNDHATKKCPFCGEEIKAEAIKCRYCREFLDTAPPQTPQNPPQPEPPESVAAPVPPTEKENGINPSAPPPPEQASIAAEPGEEQTNSAMKQLAEESGPPPERDADQAPLAMEQSDPVSHDDTPQPNSTLGKAVVDILLVFVAIIGIVLFIQQFNAIRSNEQIKAADPQAAAMQNTERAIKNEFLKKAEKGDAEAQRSLACGLLLLGKNEEAVKWLTLAAPKDTLAAWRLAWCHYNGVGTPENPEKAYQILQERVSAGKTDSNMGLFDRVVFVLGCAYWDGRECKKDEIEAVRLFQQIFPPEKAERYYPFGFDFAEIESLKFRIGISQFFKGEDLDRLEKIIPPPIDINIIASVLGRCYFEGRGGLPQDYRMGVKYLKHSNAPDAQCILGICYLEGLGVSKDDVEAVQWFRKAAEQGYEPAVEILKDLDKKGSAR